MILIDRTRDTRSSTDDIVDETIGSGRWQIQITFLLSICTLIHMLRTGTEALLRPEGYWCKKPAYLSHWSNTEWILYSHSIESCVGICNREMWDPQFLTDGYFRGCQVYDIDYTKLVNFNNSHKLSMHREKTIPCPYGIYYSNLSGQNLAQKYNRGCDNGRIVSSLWQSSSTFGRIIGYIFMGTLGDWIGRKTVIFISCGVAPIAAIIVATSTHYIVFIISSLVNGFFHGGFSLCFLLILEVSTNSMRSELLVIACCSFGLGLGLLPAINNLFASYDLMLISINILFLLLFPFIKIIPESPSWLFSTGNIQELNRIIRTGGKFNGKSVPQSFHLTYEGNHSQESSRCSKHWSIFHEPEIACEIIGIGYLTGLFALIFGSSYYSILSYVAKSQLANSLLAAATVAGMLCGQFCMLLMGHKKILQISIVLVLVSSFMLTINLHGMRPSNTGPVTTLLIINVSVVSLSYGVLINYSVRTLPTLVRGTFSGIFKSIWEAFVWAGNHDYVQFPTIGFTLIMTCVLAGLFSLNLKDLYKRELPDTPDDTINFKLKSKPKRWIIEESLEPLDDKKSGILSKLKKNSVKPQEIYS